MDPVLEMAMIAAIQSGDPRAPWMVAEQEEIPDADVYKMMEIYG